MINETTPPKPKARRRRRRAAGKLPVALKKEPCAVCGTHDARLDLLGQMSAEEGWMAPDGSGRSFTQLWEQAYPGTWLCTYCFVEVVRSDPEAAGLIEPGLSHEEWDRMLAAVYRKTGVRQTHYINYATRSELKEQAIREHGRWCYLCDLPIGDDENVHLDHVIPYKLGGPTYWSNLRPTHAACNLWKRDRSLEDLDLEAWRSQREALWLAREVPDIDAA